jgi:hypothetical protein
LGDHLFLHLQHKTKQCAVIGHSLQFQRLSQLSVSKAGRSWGCVSAIDSR